MLWASLSLLLSACIDGAVVDGSVDDTFAQSFDWGPQPPDVPLVSPDTVTDPDTEVGPDQVADADGELSPDVDTVVPPDTAIECTEDVDCLALDDGNLCNGGVACVDGACQATEATIECSQDDVPPCQVAVCDPPTGQCRQISATNGTSCDNGDKCTLSDVCSDGVCESGPSIFCDDGNDCTLDKCVNGGCKSTALNGTPCDDGNPCTTDEVCSQLSGGICKSNVSGCQCDADADCDAYDDGNACNGLMKCIVGLCKTTPSVTCSLPETGSCQAEVCDTTTGLCVLEDNPDGAGCDDQDACTKSDVCAAGVCAGSAIVCGDEPCQTGGACNAATGVCEYTAAADGTDCGVEGGCLAGATCAGGSCRQAAEACGCVADEDCAAFDDNDLCNGTLGCRFGSCVVLPDTIPVCPAMDDDGCQQHACDPAVGTCTVEPVEDGQPCDDGDLCTSSDSCAAGACVSEPTVCEGGGGCSAAACHPFAGCRTLAVGGACVAPDACAESAGCSSGDCVATKSTECTTENPCIQTGCDPLSDGCLEQPILSVCDDGDPCTENDACSDGLCSGSPAVCDDGNPCTVGVCGADGSCAFDPLESVICDDGNGCTGGDQCYDGACTGIVPLGCGCSEDADCAQFDDGNGCNGVMICSFGFCSVDETTVVVCDASENTQCLANVCSEESGACELTARGDGASCEDGDLCTTGGACSAGSCVGAVKTCDDQNPCTDDFCDAGTGACDVSLVADDSPCDDMNSCTTETVCTAGVCGGGTNSCEACEVDADCAAHEDEDLCNGTLVCLENACVVDGATVVVCNGSNDACSVTACDPTTGACGVTEADDAPCEDGDPCTVGDTCSAGACVSGDPLQCNDDTTCASNWCDPVFGGCVVQNTEATCNDDDSCTQSDGCYGGECLFLQNICPCSKADDCGEFYNKCEGIAVCTAGVGCGLEPDSEVICGLEGDAPCAFDGCDPDAGTCGPVVVPEGEACDDGDACTESTTCGADGACTGAPVVCDDGNPCTDDFCDPAVGCVFTTMDDGMECDDGDPCKVATQCSAGVCTGGGSNPQCKCLSGLDSQCAIWDDADKCNGEYQCFNKKCVLTEAVDCPITGLEPCKYNACDPLSGVCSLAKAQDGTECEDGDPCTENDVCKFTLGQCQGKAKNCADGNLCTEDSCIDGICFSDPVAFWTTSQLNQSDECVDDGPPGSGCDGNLCTKLEKCQDGVLDWSLDACANCDSDSDCEFGDTDGDKCNGIWRCLDIDEDTGKGYCGFDPDSVVTCEDDNPHDCIVVDCLPQTGDCLPLALDVGANCDDGSVCTNNDLCEAGGACVGSVIIECTDPSPEDCVDIACHPLHGTCEPTVRGEGASCSDSNQCTSGDTCVAGGCQGSLITCDDLNPCTADECSAETGCIFPALFIGDCDDGDPCTQATVCKNGECTNAQNSPDCVCDNAVDCTQFDDGDVCTGVWDCIDGTCQFKEGTEKDCEPEVPNPCVVPTCESDTGFCGTENRPDGSPCDDGDSCTKLGFCLEGVCAAEPLCDDGNECTLDTCLAATCNHALVDDGDPCDLGELCTTNDVCALGVCTAGEAVDCSCTADEDCAPLDDGDLCNGTLICVSGECRVNPTTVVACVEDASGCSSVSCDPDSGSCQYEPIAIGISCNDGDTCTADDRCDESGVCGGSPVGCADDDPCTNDVCDGTYGCVHFEFSGPCDDANPCTKQDVCIDSVCGGVLDNCDDGNPCSKDICKPGIGCTNPFESNNKSCVDGDACSLQDTCQEGVCVAGATNDCACATEGDCLAQSEGDHCAGTYACIDGGCVLDLETIQVQPASPGGCGAIECVADGAGGWQYTVVAAAEGEACDDADACTQGEVCTAGACLGEPTDCGDPVNPCHEMACLADEGCKLQHRQGGCDDGNACSVNDRCVADVCTGDPSLGPVATFENQSTDDWLLSSTGNEVQWMPSSGLVADSGTALHLVNPATGTMEDSAGAWEATAEWMVVEIPAEAINQVYVRFKVYMDVEDQGCQADTLHVLLDGAEVYERCDSTNGEFIDVELDLGTDPKGEDLVISFVVNTATADNNGGQGVVIDDVGFHWACKLL